MLTWTVLTLEGAILDGTDAIIINKITTKKNCY